MAADVGVAVTYFNDELPNRFYLPEVMGGGLGWLDFDVDGRLDLYVMNGCRLINFDPATEQHKPYLFRHNGVKFADITQFSHAFRLGFGQGCAIGDFDHDGFPDIYLACFGPDGLLRNNGDGTFTDVTETSSIDNREWGSSAVWFDVDGDRDLDVYVVNYMDVREDNALVCYFGDKPGYCGPGDYTATPDCLFENLGDGTFSRSADKLGFHDDSGKGLAVAVLDLDDDLQPDVYVANDMCPNFLLTRTRAPGRTAAGAPFAEIAINAGCAVSDDGLNEASMGVACADFDHDGRPDIFLTHFFGHKNTLYRNLGQLIFVDDSRRTRVAASSFEFNGFGVVALDFDRDGWMEVFVANGHVLGPLQKPCEMQPQLLHNDGRGRFDDVSAFAGPYFQELMLGRSVAGADFDDDGDLDLAVSHLHRPLALLRNDTAAGRHFLGLRLATPDRVPPVGGRVLVSAGGLRQVLPIVAGGSYLAAHDSRLLFGLADHADPVLVEIHWPSGRIDRVELEPDRYWHVLEGFAPESNSAAK